MRLVCCSLLASAIVRLDCSAKCAAHGHGSVAAGLLTALCVACITAAMMHATQTTLQYGWIDHGHPCKVAVAINKPARCGVPPHGHTRESMLTGALVLQILKATDTVTAMTNCTVTNVYACRTPSTRVAETIHPVSAEQVNTTPGLLTALARLPSKL